MDPQTQSSNASFPPPMQDAANEVANLIDHLRSKPESTLPPSRDLTLSLQAVKRQVAQADEGIRALRVLRAHFLEWDFVGSRIATNFALETLERDKQVLSDLCDELEGHRKDSSDGEQPGGA